MMTPARPRLLTMINDSVLMCFWVPENLSAMEVLVVLLLLKYLASLFFSEMSRPYILSLMVEYNLSLKDEYNSSFRNESNPLL